MSVHRTFSATPFLRRLLALLGLLAATYSYAKGPEPPYRIALASLGYQTPGPGSLATGGTMTTVHFVDEQHLLVTFNIRSLMKRLPDDPPGDEDHTVEAVLVQLPSGKALAHTRWRVHDAGQYLWNLGHGHFLLRIHDTLTTFAPLANLASDAPFSEQPFLTSSRRMAAILLSPDRDLITVETLDKPVPTAGDDSSQASSGRAQINFYRLQQPVQPVDRVIVQNAGIGVAAGLVDLSLTSAGYIETLQESATRWLFDFDPYVGKYIELSPFDTTCRPHPVFVSASEFVAFGCRGSDDRLSIGGFNMRGEQMWQQDFTDEHAFPSFAFAPAAGRFALSRNIVASGSGITADFAAASVTTQEIRVYQTYNGKQLLRAEASPVQRNGQNYDLSPNGLLLAVVHDNVIEMHPLPALTSADLAGIRADTTLEPKDVGAPVNLASHVKTAALISSPTTVHVEAVPAQLAPTSDATVGDLQPEQHRKPPTLYTLPTDKPREPQQPEQPQQ
ncbi:hypothetical protein [Granulicella arctica]|uniref:FHA domain-containing protein n=1 Tax=Granulicella arctica TaxID=940613 RepID=A0A7Y9TEI2_9BACT|nr:hypothetical protein [Granulicella arctica]NYF77726.1 hypothetical protein [Granulicella arctica]